MRLKQKQNMKKGVSIALTTVVLSSNVLTNVSTIHAVLNKEEQNIKNELEAILNETSQVTDSNDIVDNVLNGMVEDEVIENEIIEEDNILNDEMDSFPPQELPSVEDTPTQDEQLDQESEVETEQQLDGEEVKPAQLLINQVYGGGDASDTPFTHSFIEIYNPLDVEIDLSEYSIQYASDRSGKPSEMLDIDGTDWVALPLSGVLQPKETYLIQANQEVTSVAKYELTIENTDLQWDQIIDNKQYRVAIVKGHDILPDKYPSGMEQVVDLLAVGETGGEGQNMAGVSKQKAVRRIDYTDTNQNVADFEVIEYKDLSVEEAQKYLPISLRMKVEQPDPFKLVINEVYGGGGKAGKDGLANAPYLYDFIEIYNPTNADINLEGLSLNYTNSSGKNTAQYSFVEGQIIKANDYFLLRCEATLGNDGEKGFGLSFEADAYFDEPDAGIGISDSKGNVELKMSDTVIDAIAFGSPEVNKGEGDSIESLDIYSAARRMDFLDTNQNSTDFSKVAPSPTKSGLKEGEVHVIGSKKIADVKQDPSLIGQDVMVEGTITAINIYDEISYIQDSSGEGIAVQNLTVGQVGQKVSIEGLLLNTHNELQIQVTTQTVLDEQINKMVAKVVEFKAFKNQVGNYIKVTGTVTAKTQDSLTLNNELELSLVNSNVDNQVVEVGQDITVSGIVSKSGEDYRLFVTNEEDLVVNPEKVSDVISIEKIAGYSTGVINADGGVAEIVKYNEDNNKFYLVNGATQTMDIISLDAIDQDLTLEKSIDIAKAVNVDGFLYGDLTSVDINTEKQVIVAAVQEKDYTKNGKIVVMDYDGNVLTTFEAGVQPDMIKMTPDGKYILTANEGEPRLGLVNGVDPKGTITIVDYESQKASLVKFSDDSVIDSDVHLRNKNALTDLEPEYITLSGDNKLAYVSLQENNALATIDIASGNVMSVKSFGFKDHSVAGQGMDAANKDGEINIETLPILGAYMPDGISSVTIGGV